MLLGAKWRKMSETSALSPGVRALVGPSMQMWERVAWRTCIRSDVALAVAVGVDDGPWLDPVALWWWQNKKPNDCDSYAASQTWATLDDDDDQRPRP